MHKYLPILFLVACTNGGETDTDGGGDTDTDTTPPTCAEAIAAGTTGTIAVSIAMEEDLIPSMDEPPVGTFYGSVFRGEDVTGLGPNDGAVALQDVSYTGIDLSNEGGPADTGATITVPGCRVAILGCLDTDGNDCDESDPVTMPNDNFFMVTVDETTAVEIFLGILNPS